MKKINIEIKARSKDLSGIRDILKSLRADFRGTDHQIDTYFQVEKGKLKLREGEIEKGLIYYLRPNDPQPKKSDVIIFRSSSYEDLKLILVKLLGIMTTVDKSREIYYLDNVKIHLDEVVDLGTFVEIEAQGDPGKVSEKDLLNQCRDLMSRFAIAPGDLVSGSYSDLILEGKIEYEQS